MNRRDRACMRYGTLVRIIKKKKLKKAIIFYAFYFVVIKD